MDTYRIAIYVVAMIVLTIGLNIGAWFVLVKLVNVMGSRLSFTSFVGIRHLKGRRSGSLTLVGLLCIIAVSFSSCTLTTVLSVMGGLSGDLKQKIMSTNAHIVIDNYGSPLTAMPEADTSKGQKSDRTLDAMTDWQHILKFVEKQQIVQAASPVVQGEVMVNARSNNNGMLLKGVDPPSLSRVSAVLKQITQGDVKYINDPELLFKKTRSHLLMGDPVRNAGGKNAVGDAGDDDAGEDDDDAGEDDDNAFIPAPKLPGQRVLPALIVGQEMANALRLYVGEEVKVISPLGDIGPTGRIPKSRPFRIGGSFFSGMYAFDEHYAYTSIEAAQKFLNLEDAISEIHIVIDNPDEAEAVASTLSDKLGGRLRVRSWQELNAKLFSALKLEKIIMFILMSIAIAIASFSIVATLTMLVAEKGPEISVLMTIGANSSDVRRIFTFEGMVIGSLGSLTGLLIGYLLCRSLEIFGLPIPAETFYINKLPVEISPVEFSLVGVICFVLTVLATIYPADLAARITPVEGLKK